MRRKLTWIAAFVVVLVGVSAAWPLAGGGRSIKLDPLVQQDPDAAERQALTKALKLIEEKQFAMAAAELEPIAASQRLPKPIASALPELRKNLLQLVQVNTVTPDGELPPYGNPNMPLKVNNAHGRLLALGRVEALFTSSEKFTLMEMNHRLEHIDRSFGPDAAGKLRVELSAARFLAGQHSEAMSLLEGEVQQDHGRQVLADLRSMVVGGGTIETAQLANSVPTDKVPAVLASLVPAAKREQWKAFKFAEGPTVLARLQKQGRKEMNVIAAEETQRLTTKVNATAATLRTELGK